MARMKKVDVIAELKALNVDFDTDDYNELCALLKDNATATKPQDVVHIPNKAGGIDIPKALYERATKIIGWTDEQIATFSDAASLEMACQRIKPQASAIAATKRKPPPHSDYLPKGESVSIDFTSEISIARAVHVQRTSYDEMQMNDFLRRERIDLRSVQMVTLVRDYKPVNGIMTTEMCIDYLKG